MSESRSEIVILLAPHVVLPLICSSFMGLEDRTVTVRVLVQNFYETRSRRSKHLVLNVMVEVEGTS